MRCQTSKPLLQGLSLYKPLLGVVQTTRSTGGFDLDYFARKCSSSAWMPPAAVTASIAKPVAILPTKPFILKKLYSFLDTTISKNIINRAIQPRAKPISFVNVRYTRQDRTGIIRFCVSTFYWKFNLLGIFCTSGIA